MIPNPTQPNLSSTKMNLFVIIEYLNYFDTKCSKADFALKFKDLLEGESAATLAALESTRKEVTSLAKNLNKNIEVIRMNDDIMPALEMVYLRYKVAPSAIDLQIYLTVIKAFFQILTSELSPFNFNFR